MMKKLMILGAMVAMAFSSCGVGAGSITTEQDSLAYAIGIDLGNYIKTVDSTMDLSIVSAAMRDVMANDLVIPRDTAMAFAREYFMVRKPAKEKAASEAWLAEIEAGNSAIVKTASGLLYEIVEPGDVNIKPAATDKVRVIYEGKLKDGKIFDSSIQRGDTAEFGLDRVIKGWSEGMTYVGKGGKIKLWIPSELAYGEQGAGQAIGPNQAITFEVELIDVMPTADAATEIK